MRIIDKIFTEPGEPVFSELDIGDVFKFRNGSGHVLIKTDTNSALHIDGKKIITIHVNGGPVITYPCAALYLDDSENTQTTLRATENILAGQSAVITHGMYIHLAPCERDCCGEK